MSEIMKLYGKCWDGMNQEERFLVLNKAYNASRTYLQSHNWEQLSIDERDTLRYYIL